MLDAHVSIFLSLAIFTRGMQIMKRRHLAFLTATVWCILGAPSLLGQTNASYSGSPENPELTSQVASKMSSPEPARDEAGTAQLTIAAGDLLEIGVFGTDFSCNPDKNACDVRVSDSGSIELPLINEVRVRGLTVAQASQLIASRFSAGGFFNDPQVTVVQKEYATQGISVLGEVQKPGIYPLLGSHTLLQAISAAGGTTTKAGNDVKLIHSERSSVAERVDLSSASSSVMLTPGDTIVVSKAGIVYVVGDVKQPTGIVMESSGLTVLKAIAMAQGTNPTAKLNKAKVIRTGPSGRVEIPLSLTKILSNKAEDLPLQAEDVLFIPNSAAKSAARRSLEAILQTATGVTIYGRY